VDEGRGNIPIGWAALAMVAPMASNRVVVKNCIMMDEWVTWSAGVELVRVEEDVLSVVWMWLL
jgi:hypothetical protein